MIAKATHVCQQAEVAAIHCTDMAKSANAAVAECRAAHCEIERYVATARRIQNTASDMLTAASQHEGALRRTLGQFGNSSAAASSTLGVAVPIAPAQNPPSSAQAVVLPIQAASSSAAGASSSAAASSSASPSSMSQYPLSSQVPMPEDFEVYPEAGWARLFS